MPANFVGGTGRINGRRVVVGGDDFTVRGGAADANVGNKRSYAELIAHELHIPIIRLVDGTGGGGSVRSFETIKRTYVPANGGFRHAGEIDRRGPGRRGMHGLGRGNRRGARGGVAFLRDGAWDESALRRGTSGRQMGRRRGITKEELGGSEIHAHMSGAIDNEAESEDDAFAQIRRFLSYLPQSVWQTPPRMTPDDDPARREEELLSIVPRNRRQGYDVRRISSS